MVTQKSLAHHSLRKTPVSVIKGYCKASNKTKIRFKNFLKSNDFAFPKLCPPPNTEKFFKLFRNRTDWDISFQIIFWLNTTSIGKGSLV